MAALPDDPDDSADLVQKEDPTLFAAEQHGPSGVEAFFEGEDPESAVDDSGYRTLAHGVLSPRHRKLAQLAAQGISNNKIAEELLYTPSRVSILLKNPHIKEEISRLSEAVYMETVAQRIKGMSDSALSVIEQALRDRTGKTKISEKIEAAKWIIEKVDGKATQTHDVGGNLLGILLDKLDAHRAAGRALSAPDTIDVTPQISATPKVRTEEDVLSDWVTDYEQEALRNSGK